MVETIQGTGGLLSGSERARVFSRTGWFRGCATLALTAGPAGETRCPATLEDSDSGSAGALPRQREPDRFRSVSQPQSGRSVPQPYPPAALSMSGNCTDEVHFGR